MKLKNVPKRTCNDFSRKYCKYSGQLGNISSYFIFLVMAYKYNIILEGKQRQRKLSLQSVLDVCFNDLFRISLSIFSKNQLRAVITLVLIYEPVHQNVSPNWT